MHEFKSKEQNDSLPDIREKKESQFKYGSEVKTKQKNLVADIDE